MPKLFCQLTSVTNNLSNMSIDSVAGDVANAENIQVQARQLLPLPLKSKRKFDELTNFKKNILSIY